MIPVASRATETGNLPGEEIEFTVGDPRWIMRSTADMYSIRELAVVREYSTNARDSHIEAGRADVPIEVTLPSLMNPYFTVKDTGLGLSIDDFREVYTVFGDSTKRNSNLTNGMLGYGCKAGLAYTDTFTIVSIKDGEKAHAVVTKRPDYSISMTILAVEETHERNGVIITVPVHNYEKFAQIAKDFYRFWEPGTVLVDGAEPVRAVGEIISENFYYSNDGRCYVVMGNVPYIINNPSVLFKKTKSQNIAFVIYVPNGAVEFTPNREALKYSDQTIESLTKFIGKWEDDLIKQAKKEIKKCATSYDAYVKWTGWVAKIGPEALGDFKYKGHDLVSSIPFRGTRYHAKKPSYWQTKVYNTVRYANSLPMAEVNDSMVIKGFHIEVSSNVKNKVKEYAVQKGIDAKYFYFTSDENFQAFWYPKDRVTTWEKIREALKPVKVAGEKPVRPKRTPGTWDYYEPGTGIRQEEKPFPEGTLYYITAQNARYFPVPQLLTWLEKDAKVVVLAANRVNKFTRDHPDIPELLTYMKTKVAIDDASKLVSKKALAGYKVGYSTQDWLRKLPLDKLKDKRFAKMASAVEARNKADIEISKYRSLCQTLGIQFKHLPQDDLRAKDEVLTDYPLLRYLSTPHVEDVVLYMDAVYAARIKK